MAAQIRCEQNDRRNDEKGEDYLLGGAFTAQGETCFLRKPFRHWENVDLPQLP